MSQFPPCVICDEPVLRRYATKDPERNGFAMTCSRKCSADYSSVRDLLTDEAFHNHAIARAKHIQKYPGKYDKGQYIWAEKMLNGEVKPDRRRARPKPGSRRYAVAKRIGLLRELGGK